MNGTDGSIRVGASFRDPDGFVYRDGGKLFRRIQESGAAAYDMLMQSGLYSELADAGLLVAHEEVSSAGEGAYKTITPREIRFVTYPHEWCFSQLKDAALLTLDIQKRALARGMCMKDASAYNVLFDGSSPVFIDTLSFEPYEDGNPWAAYGQFCRHFLAPLSLMSKVDTRLGRLLLAHIDGIPLDLASRMLPASTKIDPSLLMHVHAHAKAAVKEFKPEAAGAARGVSRNALLGLIDSLESAVKKLNAPRGRSEWSDYYAADCDAKTLGAKKDIVSGFLRDCGGSSLWDFGCNTGEFSLLAAGAGYDTLALDADVACIDALYNSLKSNGVKRITPIFADLANPAPAIGWDNTEREALKDRGAADVALALALIHHIAIGNNIPLGGIASFFSRMCNKLIIEFVPKDDPQARRLLTVRKDIFGGYTREAFESEFGKYFSIGAQSQIPGTGRIVYMMAKRDA